MTLKFCSLSSGSSGNCYVVADEKTALLVDVGISGKRILEGLASVGLNPDIVKGVLITHEHVDHVRSLRVIGKKIPGAIAYANAGTWPYISDKISEDRQRTFVTGGDFQIGDIRIKSFRTSHDAAESVGFSFYSGGSQLSIVTDTGYVSDGILDEVKGADLLVLEANHEVEILRMCRYPYSVKRRIAGDMGHLSNVDAGKLLCRIIKSEKKPRRVLLAHLSKENNEPGLARMTIVNELEEEGIYTDADLMVEVILRDCVSSVYGI